MATHPDIIITEHVTNHQKKVLNFIVISKIWCIIISRGLLLWNLKKL